MIGSAEWFVERENIYRERNKRIEDACNNLLKHSDTYPGLYKSSTPGKNFLFDLSHHLALCMHPKVSLYVVSEWYAYQIFTGSNFLEGWLYNLEKKLASALKFD